MDKVGAPFAADTREISRVLGDLERRVELQSPEDDYAIHYYTSPVRDPATGEQRLQRTYRLLDLRRGGQAQECWGPFDLHKQTEIVSGLLTRSGYRVERMVSGWIATCPACGGVTEGKSWETPPRRCTVTRRCPGDPSTNVVETPAD